MVNYLDAMKLNTMSPSNYYANSFASQTMGGDDTFMGLGPVGGDATLNMGSNCGNIFGNMNGIPDCGPGSEVRNMDQKTYLKYQHDLQEMQNKFAIEDQVTQRKRLAAAGFETTAADDALTRQIGILQRKIANNEQDNIVPEYNKLVRLTEHKLLEEGLIQKGQKIPQEQLKAHAEKLYAEATGKALLDDIQANGDSSLVQGMKKGAGFGAGAIFVDKNSSDDNIAEITGESKSNTSKYWKWVGVGTAGILSLVAVRQLFRPKTLGFLGKGLKFVF